MQAAIPETRSMRDARERLRRALSQFEKMPGGATEILKSVEEEAQTVLDGVASIWKDGKEPIPFDEFCVALDGQALTDRQADAWALSNSLRASHLLDPARTITEWILVWGKRGGKDYNVAKFLSYYVYILHQLREMPAVYMARTAGRMLAPNTRLDVVNVAPNEDLARQVFFAYLKSFLQTPIFNGIQFDPKPSEWSRGTNHILCPAINLNLYSKTSKSSGLDGYNILMWILDEADDFLDNGDKSNAQEIRDIFYRTADSTFGPFAVGMNISYPRLEEGYMLRRYKEANEWNAMLAAEGKPPIYFTDLAPTAELRPDFDPEQPSIRAEYNRDPRGAAAMYECSPMAMGDAFIEFPERVVAAVDSGLRSCVDWKTEIRDCGKPGENEDWRVVLELTSAIRKEPGREYFLGCDGGKNKDSYAVALYSIAGISEGFRWLCPEHGAHQEIRLDYPYVQIMEERPAKGDELCGVCGITPGDYTSLRAPHLRWWWVLNPSDGQKIIIDEKEYLLPQVREEALIEVQPHYRKRTAERNAVADFISTGDALVKLVNTLNVQTAGFDQWQLATTIQKLRSETGSNIVESSMSLTEQFNRACLYKLMLYNNLIRNIPSDKRDREVKRLQRKGNKIDHPESRNGILESKDLYDAEAIAIWLAVTSRVGELKFSVS